MGDTVVLRASDREVAGSAPDRALLRNNLRQVVHSLVHLSPNSINKLVPVSKPGINPFIANPVKALHFAILV